MKRLRYINAIGEAVIPLLGILFWEWGLYFILLFYFIDLLVSEVFIYLKVNKIIQFQRIIFPFKLRYGRLFFNTFLAFVSIALAHLATLLIVPNINFVKVFIDFINYVELGFPIPQGYILLPLVILGNYQQYQLLFIKPGAFRVLSWKKIILTRRKALFIAIIGGITAIILSYLFPIIPELVYVVLLVAGKFYVDLKFE